MVSVSDQLLRKMIILLLCFSFKLLEGVGKAEDFKSEKSNDLHYHYYVTESSYVNDKDLYEDFQEYNDIGDDLIGKDKLRQFYENKKVEIEKINKENETLSTLITLPLSKVVKIFPVDYGESPLNVSFKPLGGDMKLENGTTVVIKDEDITVAVINKAKV